MGSQKSYSSDERKMLREELQRGQGILGLKDFEAMANVWGGLFGVERTAKALAIAATRQFKRDGIAHSISIPWGSQKKQVLPIDKMTDKVSVRKSVLTTENQIVASEKLRRLISQAKAIKQQAEGFCIAVRDFAEEFERDRQLLKKLTKLRQAVEEVKMDI